MAAVKTANSIVIFMAADEWDERATRVLKVKSDDVLTHTFASPEWALAHGLSFLPNTNQGHTLLFSDA